MRFGKKIIKNVLNSIWQFKKPNYACRIIYYHSIHPIGHLSHRPEMFYSQLQWLSNNQYICPALSDIEHFQGRDRVAYITFDDGYMDNVEYALPILKKFGFKATFFVCSGYISNGRPMSAEDGHMLYKDLTILTKECLLELKNAGMEIGSHGVTHHMMSTLTKNEQIDEFSRSKTQLESYINGPITSYSYPNGQLGAFSKHMSQHALDAGYKCICSTLWGKCHNEQVILPRCEMSHEDKIEDFIAKMTGQRDYRYFIDRIFDKSKVWMI